MQSPEDSTPFPASRVEVYQMIPLSHANLQKAHIKIYLKVTWYKCFIKSNILNQTLSKKLQIGNTKIQRVHEWYFKLGL